MSPVVMKFPSLQLWGLNQEKVKYMDSDVHILNNTLHALFLQNNGLMEEDRPLNGTSLLQTWRSYFSAKIVFEVFLSLTISWLKQAPFHTHTPTRVLADGKVRRSLSSTELPEPRGSSVPAGPALRPRVPVGWTSTSVQPKAFIGGDA